MRFAFAFLCLFVLASCDPPPPPQEPPVPAAIKTRSDLTVNVREDGSSDFCFSMHSNARSPKEATEKAIRALEASLETTQPLPEKPFAIDGKEGKDKVTK